MACYPSALGGPQHLRNKPKCDDPPTLRMHQRHEEVVGFKQLAMQRCDQESSKQSVEPRRAARLRWPESPGDPTIYSVPLRAIFLSRALRAILRKAQSNIDALIYNSSDMATFPNGLDVHPAGHFKVGRPSWISLLRRVILSSLSKLYRRVTSSFKFHVLGISRFKQCGQVSSEKNPLFM